MAEKNYTSMSDDGSAQAGPLDLDAIKSLGMKALQSGQVSPQQAAQWGQSFGLPAPPSGGGAPMTPAPKVNPLDPSNFKTAPGFSAGGKGAKSENKEVLNNKETHTGNRNTNYTPDEFMAMTNSIRNMPETQDQQKSIGDLQNMINMTQGMRVKDDAWVKPLSALADAQTGSHLAEAYQPGVSQKDLNNQLLKFQDDLAKRKGDLSKTILDGVTKLKSGTDVNSQVNSALQSYMTGLNNGGANGGLGNVRMQQLIANSGAAFDKDPILKQMTGTSNNLDRAMSMINGSTPITAKNFAILQQDMINAMAPGGAATEGKVNREMVQTLSTKLNEIGQMFGDNADLRKDDPALFKQLAGLIGQVHNDYKQSYNRRVDDIAANYTHVDVPEVQSTVREKVARLKNFGQTGAPPAQAAAPAGRTKKLEDMSQDELDAYEKSLHAKG